MLGMHKVDKETPEISEQQVEAWLHTIGRQLASFRDKRNLSQEGLGDTIGASRGAISQMENGSKGTGIGQIVRSLIALNVDIWALLGGKTAAKPTRIEDRYLHDLLDEVISKGNKNPALVQATKEFLRQMLK